MSSGAKWWTRVTAVVTGAILALVVPAHAWAASSGALEMATVAARRRSGLGLLGGLTALCCLVVVGAIVLSVLLIMRRRRR